MTLPSHCTRRGRLHRPGHPGLQRGCPAGVRGRGRAGGQPGRQRDHQHCGGERRGGAGRWDQLSFDSSVPGAGSFRLWLHPCRLVPNTSMTLLLSSLLSPTSDQSCTRPQVHLHSKIGHVHVATGGGSARVAVSTGAHVEVVVRNAMHVRSDAGASLSRAPTTPPCLLCTFLLRVLYSSGSPRNRSGKVRKGQERCAWAIVAAAPTKHALCTPCCSAVQRRRRRHGQGLLRAPGARGGQGGKVGGVSACGGGRGVGKGPCGTAPQCTQALVHLIPPFQTSTTTSAMAGVHDFNCYAPVYESDRNLQSCVLTAHTPHPFAPPSRRYGAPSQGRVTVDAGGGAVEIVRMGWADALRARLLDQRPGPGQGA